MTNSTWYTSICAPQGGPCGLPVVTDKWNSVAWYSTNMIGVHVFFLLGYFMVTGFGRNKGCAGIGVFLMAAVWCIMMISWVGLLSNAISCNNPNAPTNICTDLEACLVPEFFNDGGARCLNSPFGARSYTLTLDSLEWRTDFTYLFYVQTFMTLLWDPIILAFVMILWCGACDKRKFQTLKTK